jgi:hypothetical protein
MNPMEAINAAVEKEKGATASARALLSGLSAYIVAHASDPAALQALATALTTDADDTLTAIAANPVPGDVVTFGAAKAKK